MNMNSQVGISEDQLANRSECTMTIRLFSRAAKRADQIVGWPPSGTRLLPPVQPSFATQVSLGTAPSSTGACSFTAPQFDNRVEPSHA